MKLFHSNSSDSQNKRTKTAYIGGIFRRFARLTRFNPLQNRIFLWALTAALAGFLFGFDTVVISGADKTIQSLWQLSPITHGLAMSMALWGTVLGSMAGGVPTDRWGRKRTLLLIGMLYLASAIWSALANDVYSFMIARFIGGIGVGISTVAAPLYISEISPAKSRGWLAGLFQFNIVFGILVAMISNSIFSGFEGNGWRWMLGAEAVPAIAYTLLCFSLPNSPRWLMAVKQDRMAAEKVLAKVNPDLDAAAVASLADSIGRSLESRPSALGFWSAQLKKPITLAFLIAFFNQLSGINIIMYFAPRLLGLAGFQNEFSTAIALGLVNLIFTMAGLWLIDRLGRKSLLLIGSVGYIVSLGVCGWAFLNNADFRVISAADSVIERVESVSKLEQTDYREVSDSEMSKANQELQKAKEQLSSLTPNMFDLNDEGSEALASATEVKQKVSERLGSSKWIVLTSLLAFIASHAIGQGAVIWVFISEIFPNAHRAAGQALGCFTHWIFAAVLTLLFPIVIANVDPGWLFLFFCGMMVLQLFWVLLMVPETKGISLEQIEQQLSA